MKMTDEELEQYKMCQEFFEPYYKHGIVGLSSFFGVLEYAQFADKLTIQQAQQLLYEFVSRLLLGDDAI